MNDNILRLKKEIAYFMRRLYNRGLTTTSGGNLSVKTNNNTVLITPSASDKGRMRFEEIGEVDFTGTILRANEGFRPTIEMEMHLSVYKARPDVYAIVHAHPVMCSAIAVSTKKINTHSLSESYAILGEPGYTEYAAMGSKRLAKLVSSSIKNHNCLIMRNHGAITVGKDLLQAFDRLEILEAAAQITCLTEFLFKDKITKLTKNQLSLIDKMMGRK